MKRRWLDYAKQHFDKPDDHSLECDVIDAKEVAAEIDLLREALRKAQKQLRQLQQQRGTSK